MLNKHGGGELYFGVKDNGDVIGQDVTDSTIRQVAGWIADKIEPPISPTIERLASDDSRVYVRVAFSGVEGPYSADGRYFIRVGTSNKAMTASDELSATIIKRDRARNPGTPNRPADPHPTSTRRRCATSLDSATRRAASPPGSRAHATNSTDSGSSQLTARSPMQPTCCSARVGTCAPG